MNPEELGSGAVVAVLVSEFMEMMKRSNKFPWMTQRTDMVNRLIGGGAAFLSGLGLQWQFDPVAGKFVLEGLFVSSIVHAFAQWAGQQAYYRLALHSHDATPVNVKVMKKQKGKR